MLDIGKLASAATPCDAAIASPRARPALVADPVEELHGRLATVLHGLYDGAAHFALYVSDGRGKLVPARHGDDGSDDLLPALATTRAMTALHPAPALARLGNRSVMGVPLRDEADELAGLVVVERSAGAPDFTRSDVAVLEGVAELLAAALQRLSALEVEAARAARIDVDREAARRVQRRLMSTRLPSGIGVTANAEYQPAFDVGGDFYTLKHLGDGIVGIAIGDVSGNGVSAALVMSRVVSDIERALSRGEAPSAVLRSINEAVADLDSEMFVTATCARLDTARRTLTVSNAGHLPLLVRRANGDVFPCAGASGTPLGMLPSEYDEEELHLERRDILLLMTDGLLEALDHPSGRMGMELLVGLLREDPHDPRRINERIRAIVDGSRRRHALDDVTWVQLQLSA